MSGLNYKESSGSVNIQFILEKMEKLHQIHDLHALLDRILYETRKFTGADAGTIFLVQDRKLIFSYVQNESLFKNDILCSKYIYSNRTIEINNQSLAGFTALNGEIQMIDDAYNIPPGAPYTFNTYFDTISNYKTRSILNVPIKTGKGSTVGVLQLINVISPEGEIIPFSPEHKLFVSQYAFHASVAIERARMLREIVLNMVKLSELRDPQETGAHVNRVGAIAIEIYQKWSSDHNVPREEVSRYKDILRIAAMLLDVGKVGISDILLRKKGKLTPGEFELMKQHTIIGGRLFYAKTSDWEKMAYEIIMNHHEKWDGSGYPGKVGNIFDSEVVIGPGKKMGEIPLSARIVAIADVFDALSSERVYKDPWEEERVLHYLRTSTGTHFDPELVAIFFDIYDVIKAIRNKWT